ncbi:MAG: hypothetical protein RIR51_504 [Bacteroidota bacterium]|jgi:N-acetylglucosamine kinase-like BadF-type ATPase
MILIIESGSTNTNWRMVIAMNEKPIDFYSEGINPHYQNLQEIDHAQIEIIRKITSEFSPSNIVYFGTGISSNEKKDIIKGWLIKYFPNSEIRIENDLLGSAIANLGEEKGIIAILGTGSNSGFFNGKIIESQIPTLGFWLGDEGSGGHLGKLLIMDYFKNHLSTELKEKFENRFGIINRETILENAYSKPFPNRWFGGFSKFLFDNRKDPQSYAIIKKSFQAFIDEYILKYPEAKSHKIHFIGSIAFFFSDILKQVLKENNLQIGIISEKAMPGLTLFYKKFL